MSIKNTNLTIEDILEALSLPTNQFNAFLKSFEESYTDARVAKKHEKHIYNDMDMIFEVLYSFYVDRLGDRAFGNFIQELNLISLDAKTTQALYNLLRLLKKMLWISDVHLLYRYVQELMIIYSSSIFFSNGNLKMAGYRLLSEMIFALTILEWRLRSKRGKQETIKYLGIDNADKLVNIVDEVEFAFIALYEYLMDVEYAYTETHTAQLEHNRDLHGYKYRKNSTETHDKFLKHVRRGIELFFSGYWFDNILDKHGMLKELRSAVRERKYRKIKDARR